MKTRIKGHITWWKPASGFGFIATDSRTVYFTHIKEFGDIDESLIKAGEPVTFSYDPNDNPEPPAKPRAYSIELIRSTFPDQEEAVSVSGRAVAVREAFARKDMR